MKTKIILATTNKSKIQPFTMAWRNRGLDKYYQLINLIDTKINSKIIINEDTGDFEQDALKKAKEYQKSLNLPTISIDRGIGFNALGGWPGTESKEVFAGNEKRLFNSFSQATLKLTEREQDVKRSQTVLDRIKNKNRAMESLYGIAVVFNKNEYISDKIIIEGNASVKLKPTQNGYFYDWFFIPQGYDKTFSEFGKEEYSKFASEILWPITDKIYKFLTDKLA